MMVPHLTVAELAEIDLSSYAFRSELFFVHVVVQRGKYWYTALVQVRDGRPVFSSVYPEKFTSEEAARQETQQQHRMIRAILTSLAPDFEVKTRWFDSGRNHPSE